MTNEKLNDALINIQYIIESVDNLRDSLSDVLDKSYNSNITLLKNLRNKPDKYLNGIITQMEELLTMLSE